MSRVALLITLIAIAIITGCATERYTAATITSQPREINLKQPILASVFDGRTNGENPQAASELRNELTRIYGDALLWSGYFDSVPKGRVAVRVRIVTLGASFGSRLVSSVGYASAVSAATGVATGPWGSVVGSASGSSTMFASSFSGEGWWNGASWIDVEVQDRTGPKDIRFTVPLVAEHKESNMWGYKSGDKAAQKAWQSTSSQLTWTVDEIIRVVRDAED